MSEDRRWYKTHKTEPVDFLPNLLRTHDLLVRAMKALAISYPGKSLSEIEEELGISNKEEKSEVES